MDNIFEQDIMLQTVIEDETEFIPLLSTDEDDEKMDSGFLRKEVDYLIQPLIQNQQINNTIKSYEGGTVKQSSTYLKS